MDNGFSFLNKEEIIRNLCSQMEEPFDLEKGQKAQLGEIRTWKGGKYQKTTTGWKPFVMVFPSIADDVKNFQTLSPAKQIAFYEDYEVRTSKCKHKLDKATKANDTALISHYKPKYEYMQSKLDALKPYYDQAKIAVKNAPSQATASSSSDKYADINDGDILTMAQVQDIFNKYNKKPELQALGDKVFEMVKTLGVPVRVRKIRGNAIGLYHGSGYIEYDTRVFDKTKTRESTLVCVLLHEAIHACTCHYLENDNYLNPKTPLPVKEACEELVALYKETKSALKGNYGATNAHEFVSELANPVFRKVLKALNVWQRVVSSLKKMFFGKEEKGTVKVDPLEVADKALNAILDNEEADFLIKRAKKFYRIEEARGIKHFF